MKGMCVVFKLCLSSATVPCVFLWGVELVRDHVMLLQSEVRYPGRAHHAAHLLHLGGQGGAASRDGHDPLDAPFQGGTQLSGRAADERGRGAAGGGVILQELLPRPVGR